VSTNAVIPLRVIERASETHWQTEAQAELKRPFQAEEGPLLRAVVIYGKPISELILVTHHSIGDGLSALYLVGDLLKFMDGIELTDLPAQSSLEELLGSEKESQPTSPTLAPERPPELRRLGKPVIASFEIEAPEVEMILARCRAEGTTLQGALMAVALLLVGGPVVRCLAPANVRRLCPPIAGDFGLYISSGIALHENRSGHSLWEVARSARAQLMHALAPSMLRARSEAVSLLLVGNRDSGSVYEAFRQRVTHDVVVSNLGRFALPASVSSRVTALYLFLNCELEPVLGIASSNERMCVTLTSDQPNPAEWLGAFQDRFRMETLEHAR
jgi:hypothetical protein